MSKTTQKDVERKAAAGARRAAVLVPICVVDGELSCVFCVRSAAVSTHKSQVSFPGGHREDGESAADAALDHFVDPLDEAVFAAALDRFEDQLARALNAAAEAKLRATG